MKKLLAFVLVGILAFAILFYSFVYFVPYSEGTRAGELIKFSRKGVLVKTWEGQISQGISGAQIFDFSVMGSKQDVIDKLKEYQGSYVKLTYEERYATFFFWGDTKYFITDISKENSPHFNRE
ncbi:MULTISPECIES: 6-phosphogluconate dehydrogenase [unclassified Leeuwenhoekiella]|uniref:6-phosphogluconate dehydrogenase n=1 Tax=unclassified Leeuwenhoekiella TaxID=2615029 RepID=UPI000C51C354|nr:MULTISPECIES: 6-phosphogluconate dehydrogenase [unclassified Leeuwenhoekiella]MAW94750.1 6-phosphogluconate dehydrogenase [Leeuwenhoekiella sp.]MAW95525.1 6-phosphogluconate dehydrogenase [Leeuwenhoekiella sp.]MBA82173.1 6-phosphogluconate dehydrogenase [Leeuwenhoekiella sp.]|tara:strand:- start:21731 stop:22099 length:369 start_codon:yes stop_codon:yes gene_type:complete